MSKRGEAIYDTWQREIDSRLADIIFFADMMGKQDSRFKTIKLKNVRDNEYPPQRKAFRVVIGNLFYKKV